MNILYWSDDHPVTKDYLRYLIESYSDIDGPELIEAMVKREMPGQFAIVSSFGIESAVLLHMVSQIDPCLPVIFLDTDKLFPETLAYRDQLIDMLGLKNVKTIGPAPLDIQNEDRDGDLHKIDPDRCCHIRKVEPLNKALAEFNGWISGRKRFHGGTRSHLPTIEMSNGRVKINPLAFWPAAKIQQYYDDHNLPPHPLKDQGYLSVGCECCTSKPLSEGDVRSGRWVGQEKKECGIHIGDDGRIVRTGSGTSDPRP